MVREMSKYLEIRVSTSGGRLRLYNFYCFN